MDHLLGYHKPNTLFVLDGLRGNLPSVVTTEAITPITVIPLIPEQLEELCDHNAELGHSVLLYIGDVLRLMCYEAENQSIPDVTSRLIHFLFLYSMSTDTREIPLSQENLAAAISASRVQTARACELMKEKGYLKLGRRKVTIIDANGMLNYSTEKR